MFERIVIGLLLVNYGALWSFMELGPKILVPNFQNSRSKQYTFLFLTTASPETYKTLNNCILQAAVGLLLVKR